MPYHSVKSGHFSSHLPHVLQSLLEGMIVSLSFALTRVLPVPPEYQPIHFISALEFLQVTAE